MKKFTSLQNQTLLAEDFLTLRKMIMNDDAARLKSWITMHPEIDLSLPINHDGYEGITSVQSTDFLNEFKGVYQFDSRANDEPYGRSSPDSVVSFEFEQDNTGHHRIVLVNQYVTVRDKYFPSPSFGIADLHQLPGRVGPSDQPVSEPSAAGAKRTATADVEPPEKPQEGYYLLIDQEPLGEQAALSTNIKDFCRDYGKQDCLSVIETQNSLVKR